MDLAEAHAQALDHTARLVAGIADDQWALPSDCDGWDVRTLVNHVVEGNFWAGELMAGKTIEEVGDRLDGDVLGDDPVAAYGESARVAAAAFRGEGAMERPAAVSYGPVPGEVYCGHRFIDVLVHGWDIAESTRQDANLPEDLVAECWAVVEPQLDQLRGSGAYGEDLDVAADADLQTRLLAALGRRG